MTGPALVFQSPAANTVYYIDTTPKMPELEIDVRVHGVRPDPTASTKFVWTVQMTFDEAQVCTYGKNGAIFRDSFREVVTGGKYRPRFPWIRGGQLSLTAEAAVSGVHVRATLLVWIFGTDPPWSLMSPLIGDDTLRRIVKLESLGGHQFENDAKKKHHGVPVLNRGHDGGGGVCQITPPTSDDLWNWRHNIASGRRVFQEKQNQARHYLNHHRVNGHYPNNGSPHGPCKVGPGVDDETVLQWETIQRYNGGTHWHWNAQKQLWESRPQYSHEYVALVLSKKP
jgi:hypothetical protein